MVVRSKGGGPDNNRQRSVKKRVSGKAVNTMEVITNGNPGKQKSQVNFPHACIGTYSHSQARSMEYAPPPLIYTRF